MEIPDDICEVIDDDAACDIFPSCPSLAGYSTMSIKVPCRDCPLNAAAAGNCVDNYVALCTSKNFPDIWAARTGLRLKPLGHDMRTVALDELLRRYEQAKAGSEEGGHD